MKKDLLVVIHVYYTDQLDLIIDSLKNIHCDYDLYITSDKKNKQIINKKISKQKKDFFFIDVENIGYDIWPFIKVINSIDLTKYKYLIKLHTKRDMYGENLINGDFVHLGNGYFIDKGPVWRDNLFEFIKTPENLQKCINALKNSRHIGMCCRYNLINNNPDYFGIMTNAKREYPKYILDINNYCFVAGTMFISKIKPIQLIKNMNITKDLFEKSSNEHKTQFAHVIERTLGAAVYKSGMIIYDPFTDSKHICYINKLYKRLKWVKRAIGYIVFFIPVLKFRRKTREKLMNIFFYHFLSYVVKIDNN